MSAGTYAGAVYSCCSDSIPLLEKIIALLTIGLFLGLILIFIYLVRFIFPAYPSKSKLKRRVK